MVCKQMRLAGWRVMIGMGIIMIVVCGQYPVHGKGGIRGTTSTNPKVTGTGTVTVTVTDNVTESLTDNVTESLTDNVTESLTDNVTQSVTDNVTEVPTAETTAMSTEKCRSCDGPWKECEDRHCPHQPRQYCFCFNTRAQRGGRQTRCIAANSNSSDIKDFCLRNNCNGGDGGRSGAGPGPVTLLTLMSSGAVLAWADFIRWWPW